MNRFQHAVSPFRNRNFRIYFAGQATSSMGEWAQKVGQAWLVLELTGSGTLLGITAGLQHLPTLLIGPWGGLLADRVDKRRMLMFSQGSAGLIALTLGVLTATGIVQVWMVLLLAMGLGTVKAIDKPARQSLTLDMVGPDDLVNAVTLTSVVHNAAKAVGPAIAGVLISVVGLAPTFFVNAGSYLGVILALVLVRAADLQPAPRAPRAKGQLREGLRYAWAAPKLRGPLLLMLASGILAYEWAVTLPLLARDAFAGGAQTFGAMFSAMGLGAVVGGVILATWMKASTTTLLTTALGFSGIMLLTAVAPSLWLAFVALFLLGAGSIAFRSTATSLIMLRSEPQMRGRVMSLLSIAMTGSTPIGGPLLGWLAEIVGIRTTFVLGGVTTAAAGVASFLYVRRHRTARPVIYPTPDVPDRLHDGMPAKLEPRRGSAHSEP